MPTRFSCLDDVQLLDQVGATDFPINAVQVIEQDTSSVPRTVTVNLNQEWSKTASIDHIFTYYHLTPLNRQCYESTYAQGERFETLTISCNFLQPKAYLEICVADNVEKNVLTINDDADVPKCCYPTFPPETPVVCYSLLISCEPCETPQLA